MRLVLNQIARLLVGLLVLYGAMLALSLVLVRPASSIDRLDAARASRSLFLTEPKYVFMARSRLDTPADKVLLLGASNALVGFRQAQVQALLPSAEVHNLSVGGSNITQLAQIVDLVREVQTPLARRHDTWVIGLWYGLFADDAARWHTPDRHAGDTDIDIERYRYGFYRRSAAGPVALLPPQQLALGVTLIHPYLVLDRSARDLSRMLRQLVDAAPAPVTDAQRNAIVLDDAQKRRHLAFWRAYMGGAARLGDAPFRTLDRVVDDILADGGRVVLVDLPIPDWHAQGSVLAADYRQRADALLARWAARPGVSVLKITDTAGDDFSDEVHPKPRQTGVWAQQLAAALNARTESTQASAASSR